MSASFNLNGFSTQTPIGSFVAIAKTSSFVEGVFSGWVLCDGTARSNATGIYTNLVNMGIGSISGSNYLSPNLNSAIMSGNQSLTLNTFPGSNSITLLTAQLPSHTHSITIGNASHTHTYTDYIADNNGGTTVYTNEDNSNEVGSTNHSLTRTRTTTGTPSDAHAHTITVDGVNGTTTGTAFNTKNTAFHIQWIVKYA